MATRYVLIGVLWSFTTVIAGGGPGPAGAVRTFLAQSSPQAAQASAAPSPSASARAETVLIFPFENLGKSARLDWLSEGLAELTRERLTAAGQQVFTREERLAALEKLGLPASTRFTHATMLKIAEEIDADYVVFGQYTSDGKALGMSAELLHVDPPALSRPLEETGALGDLMETHARLAWRILTSLEPAALLSQREFSQKLMRPRLDAFEYYVRGLGGRDDQRIEQFRQAAQLEPAWAEPAFALGEAYFARHDCQAAVSWLSRVPPNHERSAEAGFYAGVCSLVLKDAGRAEVTFERLLERLRASRTGSVQLPEAFNNLGIARERLGKTKEAIADFERAVRLDPDEVDYWFNLGLTDLRMNEPAAAVKPFREALRRKPDDVQARALLIAALQQSGRASEAAAEREQSKGGEKPQPLPSTQPEALARLDRIKMRLDPASLRLFPESIIEAASAGASSFRRSQHHQLHLTRGQEFLAAGKLEDAQREFSQAALLVPLDPTAHLGLAEVYRRQNRYDDAARELRAGIAGRDDAASHTLLARLYLEQNRPAEAREELRLALKLDPSYAEARQLLERLEGRANSGEPR